MRVGIIGTAPWTETRTAVIRAMTGVVLAGYRDALSDLELAHAAGPGARFAHSLADFLETLDVAFIGGSTATHYFVAEAAARRGVHLFLEWPPATSLGECEAMLRLVEEAGVEAGVSRPLRYHPVFAECPPSWQPNLILLRQTLPEAPRRRHLAGAVDLCCALARSGSVQRIDAEAARSEGARPDAVAFALRFHNGAYAQVSLRRAAAPASGHLYAAGGGVAVETSLPPFADPAEHAATTGALAPLSPANAVATETRHFMKALAERRPAPVSILDALHTLRLVERLMERLR